jgi:ribose transport system ATP-binding protein
VLVLDEPTSSLTAADVRHLEALVERLRDRGHASLFISRVLEEVRSFADRVTVLRDGATAGDVEHEGDGGRWFGRGED